MKTYQKPRFFWLFFQSFPAFLAKNFFENGLLIKSRNLLNPPATTRTLRLFNAINDIFATLIVSVQESFPPSPIDFIDCFIFSFVAMPPGRTVVNVTFCPLNSSPSYGIMLKRNDFAAAYTAMCGIG